MTINFQDNKRFFRNQIVYRFSDDSTSFGNLENTFSIAAINRQDQMVSPDNRQLCIHNFLKHILYKPLSK